MTKCFITAFLFGCFQILCAQNIEYVRLIIDTLTSETYAGRGYSDNGMQKSAGFIEKEFRKHHLLNFGGSYTQTFSIPANTITYCKVEKGRLNAGYDYVVDILSGDISGKHKVFIASGVHFADSVGFRKFFETDHSKHVIVFPPSVFENSEYTEIVQFIVYSGLKKAKGFIFGTEKQPTWHVSNMHNEPLDAAILKIRGDENYFASLRKISIDVRSEYIPDFPLANVCGYIPGSEHPDSFIVFCAHYDHLGKMGDVVYPGANDNASGVAMMLDLTEYFSDSAHRLPYSVAFLAMTAEEAGILGAEYFTMHPMFELSRIKFLINLDIIGTGREGVQVVNGSIFRKEFDTLVRLNDEKGYLPQVKIRGEACNSDHCPFYKKGVPSFFIYSLDQEYTWYHVPQDKSSELPLTGYENIFRLIRDFCNEIR